MSEDEDGGDLLGDFFSKKTHRTPNYEVNAFGRLISIAQESRMHLGGRVWGASVHMLRYFTRCAEMKEEAADLQWQRPTLLELGAGTGLLGIGMAFASAAIEVRLTDKSDLLPQIQDNIRLNLSGGEGSERDGVTIGAMTAEISNGRSANCVAMELDWMKWADDAYWQEGGAGHKAASGVDVVLAADCIYFASLYQPFIETLKRICRTAISDSPACVVCYLCNDDGRTAQNRTTSADEEAGRWDDGFFQLLAVDFVFEWVDTDAVLPSHERNSDMRMYRVRLK